MSATVVLQATKESLQGCVRDLRGPVALEGESEAFKAGTLGFRGRRGARGVISMPASQRWRSADVLPSRSPSTPQLAYRQESSLRARTPWLLCDKQADGVRIACIGVVRLETAEAEVMERSGFQARDGAVCPPRLTPASQVIWSRLYS